MDVKKIFGSNLRQYRKKNHLTQEALAEAIGVTSKHLGLIENGSTFVSAELIEKASAVLGISPATLFYSDEEISGSDSFLSTVDRVIDEEMAAAIKNIRHKIRENLKAESSGK